MLKSGPKAFLRPARHFALASLTALAMLLAPALPADASHDAPQLLSAGSATRTIFFMDVYEVTIRTHDGSFNRSDLTALNEPKSVTIECLYDGDLPELPEGWTSELVPATEPATMDKIRTAYQGLGEGDRLTISYVPGGGTAVTRNGDHIVQTTDYDLMAAMLRVWFGDTPVSDDINEAFLQADN